MKYLKPFTTLVRMNIVPGPPPSVVPTSRQSRSYPRPWATSIMLAQRGRGPRGRRLGLDGGALGLRLGVGLQAGPLDAQPVAQGQQVGAAEGFGQRPHQVQRAGAVG